MDLTPNNNTHTTGTDPDTQTPPATRPTNKSSPFTNGTLKRHQPTSTAPPPPPPSMVVSYKECLKNHAASIGGHALDGCGEFMPSSSSNPNQPRSLTCAACGCHRNFHRRDQEQQHYYSNPNFISFYHSPPPPAVAPPLLPHRGLSLSTSPSSPSPSPSPSPISSPSSPPPISHHFPPSYAPHMLLALGNASSDDHHLQHQQHRSFFNTSVAKAENNSNNNSSGKKRYRTKFTHEQKQKMHDFSEKLGWKMNKGDEGLVQDFCNDIGVPRGVFKVWMHNNKNTFKKRSMETMANNAPSDEKINGHDHNANGTGGGFESDINNSLQQK